MVLDVAGHTELGGLARAIADVQERDGRLYLAVIHKIHAEMLEPHVPELERICGMPIGIERLAMLEEIYDWGVDISWHIKDQD